MKIIAKIHSPFPSKFGIPRQSGLVSSITAEIIFEPQYRISEAFRGLEGFSHIWLLWEFSEAVRNTWSPTVRPPRLGGNKRMGVFATRSPFRPNPIGLSCVRLEEIVLHGGNSPKLIVSGADLLDNTPIYDIKPYLPSADCIQGARGGFTENAGQRQLVVHCSDELINRIPPKHRRTVKDILAQDPRPSYQHDPNRIYGMEYIDMNIKFSVDGDILTVKDINNSQTKL